MAKEEYFILLFQNYLVFFGLNGDLLNFLSLNFLPSFIGLRGCKVEPISRVDFQKSYLSKNFVTNISRDDGEVF